MWGKEKVLRLKVEHKIMDGCGISMSDCLIFGEMVPGRQKGKKGRQKSGLSAEC